MLTSLAAPLQAGLLVFTATAAYIDLRSRKIPNWLTLAGCVAGLAGNVAVAGLGGLRDSILGFGLGFLLYVPLWLLHARGAGDVKLLAAAGAIVGPGNAVGLFLLAALIGGAFALGLVLLRGAVWRTAANVALILQSLLRLQPPQLRLNSAGALRLPHAPVMFAAAVAELFIVHRQ